MRWAVVLVALTAGCQASLGGDPAPATDAGTSVDASTTDATQNDARIIPDGPLPDAQLCDAGDVNAVDPATGNCYMLFQTVRNWVDARMQCAALGLTSHLAVITTAEENGIVAPMAGVLDVWMGGNDLVAEMTWEWLNGEPFVWDNWRDGEPNDGNKNGEDCMIIEGDRGGTWDDRNCSQQYAYLCERE